MSPENVKQASRSRAERARKKDLTANLPHEAIPKRLGFARFTYRDKKMSFYES